MPSEKVELRGLGVSAGVAGGPLHRMAAPPALPEVVPAVDDAAAEVQRAEQALESVAAELNRRADHSEAAAAEVLQAQAMIATDPSLIEAIGARVAAGRPAAWAVTDAIAEQRTVFESLGGYMAERVADLEDIRDRAVAVLMGVPMPGLPDVGHPFVLAAEDLAPADTALLDPRLVLGLVTSRGGPTSHTAILAKALGLPAVVACPGILEVADGTPVTVDGSTGDVRTVTAEKARAVQEQAEQQRLRLEKTSGPGRTSDGAPVPLLLNVGSAGDLADVPDGDFEGVGLFRTEFLYLGRTDAPTIDQQRSAYAELFTAMGGRKVVLRTLDAGADKPLPFLGLTPEDNPALGVRGLRVARTRPDVLAGQLEAVAQAAEATDADIWVMAPMVATRTEAAEFADRVHERGLSRAGVMVEVPSAALQAARLLEVVDFLSIGTNDLSQYTLAADRMCGELADLLDPWQPALLQLIGQCAAAGRDVNKPVSICGESASDPLLALVFVGMGITSLSMSARSIPAVRGSLAAHSMAECEKLAKLALAAPDAETARQEVAAAAHQL